jgi:Tfp pilus assembly protein PilE
MLGHNKQAGFSMVELLIATIVVGFVGGALALFFSATVEDFFRIEETSISVNDKTRGMYRIAQVVRTGTTISEASANSLTIYAYFSPQDSVLSKVRYYYSSTTNILKADRIKAVGSAPNYTYPSNNTETYTIVKNLKLTSDLFGYKDANGNSGPFDASTFKDIKTVSINLNTVTDYQSFASQLKTTIEIRSRKTNL